jgi:uncharacterized protein (TIGR02118 family)
MVTLFFCARRLPHLSREEFQKYWRERHGPLVKSHAATLRIHRYVQHHTALDPANDALRASRGGPEAFDGIAELQWQSQEVLAAALDSPEGRAAGLALLEDEKRFIDLANSPLHWEGDANVVIAG